MPAQISKEDARLCASVVKEVARSQGIVRDPGAIESLTTSVARVYNRGMRDRDQLLAAAIQSIHTPVTPPDPRA